MSAEEIEYQSKERQDSELRNERRQGSELRNKERQDSELRNEIRPEDDWSEEDWREEERREQERRQRRRQRIEEMKREKHRREMMYRYGVPGVAAAAVLCIVLLIVGIVKAVPPKDEGESGKEDNSRASQEQGGTVGSREEGREEKSPIWYIAQAGKPSEWDIAQTGKSSAWYITQAGKLFEWDIAQAAGIFALDDTAQPDGGSGDAQTEVPGQVFEAHTTDDTNGFSDSIISEYGIMIDVESGEILAQKNGWERINPASMTKILTVLVAAEHMTDLEGTFTMTIEITDYSFLNDCSNVGFAVGEEIPVRDLFYGTALQSGADAALGLAYYVAGSHEAFVDMMNEKLEELGLSETTHFTNCVGLYDENHYSTAYDMAVILKEAADNEFCRQILSEHHYVTTPTAEHPEGIDISNWFLRRIEDRDTHGEVLCAKTGYVVQSKNCAASLAADHNGREYICVTAGSDSSWTCIRDHVELYQRYLPAAPEG